MNNKITIDLTPLKGSSFSYIDVIAYLAYKHKDEIIASNSKDKVTTTVYNESTGEYSTSLNQEVVILMESCLTTPKKENKEPDDFYMYHLDFVALQLKGLFPKGKKTSSVLWAESIPMIKKRLQLFNNKYPGYYSAQQIIEATKKYVNSFNGVTTHMRALKYFIFKNDVKTGEVEPTSDLLNYLEDDSTEIMTNNDWTAELV